MIFKNSEKVADYQTYQKYVLINFTCKLGAWFLYKTPRHWSSLLLPSPTSMYTPYMSVPNDEIN